ncbi:MAG: 50S ribosomal protein L25 [Phycisphaerales bacterium]|nr:50S ribosomal protein L25 [Phycisphaerales bacterium]
MQTSHTLKARKRERIGSRYAARERAAGRLPAVIYGHGVDPLHISLDAKEALRYFHDGERVFALAVDGGKGDETVLLKELQFDYLGTNVVHADLMRVDLNEEIEASVHINFVGEAPGLKSAGAIMTHPYTAMTIKCTVAALPDHIDVDVSKLNVGDSLHARDIALPAGIELAMDEDTVIAAISMVKEASETGEAAEGAESSEPEVITEKKQEDKGQ